MASHQENESDGSRVPGDNTLTGENTLTVDNTLTGDHTLTGNNGTTNYQAIASDNITSSGHESHNEAGGHAAVQQDEPIPEVEEDGSKVGDTYKVIENSEAAFRLFYDQMVTLHSQLTEESAARAENIAFMLISQAELPLLFRVRAHIVLASGNGHYMWHAHEAVRVAQRGIEIFGAGPNSEALLADAEEVRRRAQRDHQQLATQKAEMEAQGYEFVDGDREDGEEVEDFKYGGSDEEADPTRDEESETVDDTTATRDESTIRRGKPAAFSEIGRDAREHQLRRQQQSEAPTAASTRPHRQRMQRTLYDPVTGKDKEV